jgi:hypothetical protein
MEYTTAGENAAAPHVYPDVALPSGGRFYPPGRYLDAVDNESLLRRLDRHLGTSETNEYVPSVRSNMFNAQALLPPRTTNSSFISELSVPQATLRAGPYPCREEADAINIERSKKLFNNATKQDKYNQTFPTKKMRVLAPGSGAAEAAKLKFTQQIAETAEEIEKTHKKLH